MNEELNNNNSSVKVLTILVIILLVAVLCLGGYLVYSDLKDNDNNKGNDNTNDVTENNKEEEKEEEYDLVEAKKLVDKYYINSFFSGNSFNGYTEELKFWIAYKNLDQNQLKIMNCDDIYGGRTDVSKESDGTYVFAPTRTCNGTQNVVHYEDISKVYKSLFGNDEELKKDAISQFDYVSEKDIYVLLSCNCGGADPTAYMYGVKTAKTKGNTLIVEVGHYALKMNENGADEYYCDLNNKVYSSEEVFKDTFEESFVKENLDKFATYEFTFFKEDGIYKFENMLKK